MREKVETFCNVLWIPYKGLITHRKTFWKWTIPSCLFKLIRAFRRGCTCFLKQQNTLSLGPLLIPDTTQQASRPRWQTWGLFQRDQDGLTPGALWTKLRSVGLVTFSCSCRSSSYQGALLSLNTLVLFISLRLRQKLVPWRLSQSGDNFSVQWI